MHSFTLHTFSHKIRLVIYFPGKLRKDLLAFIHIFKLCQNGGIRPSPKNSLLFSTLIAVLQVRIVIYQHFFSGRQSVFFALLSHLYIEQSILATSQSFTNSYSGIPSLYEASNDHAYADQFIFSLLFCLYKNIISDNTLNYKAEGHKKCSVSRFYRGSRRS